MEIYLMQHGDCFTKEENPDQPLTKAGEEQIRLSAQAIKKMGITFGLIVSSTKERAVRTAEIVADAVGYPAEKVLKTGLLKPMAPPGEALSFLGQYPEQKAVLIAGHLPSLAEIASFLLTEGSRAAIRFQRGGIGRIDVEGLPSHAGELCWYLTPEQLRLMGS